MYPAKFNLYRVSKGIKKPIIYEGCYEDIIKKEGLGEPSYTTSLQISINDFTNYIYYEQYNKKRK